MNGITWDGTVYICKVIYIAEKSKGLKTLPWGSPDRMRRKLERLPLLETHCLLLYIMVRFELAMSNFQTTFWVVSSGVFNKFGSRI